VGVGAYAKGRGKDLGNALEFRTTAEGGWQFDNGARLGVLFSHTSNANIVQKNPGTEALLVSLQVPIGALFGN
ncbi:MAG: acyloxyacyl hydrolase, partial [Rhodospirillales bacterium]|nr:acyloxyacyl hydrolase [Rhodospirillales bacterium]